MTEDAHQADRSADPQGERPPSPGGGLAGPASRMERRRSVAVTVDGFAETLQRVRHELDIISHASKFDWVNKRLIVLRNSIIAFGAVAAVLVTAGLCYHEAYRQTLRISAFEVPEHLAERGITGQVVARALFDELVKRRKTVTTLDAGDVKEGWTEHQGDVAIPETHFTLQALFRYLRQLTGNEIVVDGEMLVHGDEVVIKTRVAGSAPLAVRGKLDDWESLLGELANYVYGSTQPAVLVSYLGLAAKTPADVAQLSRYIVTMANANPRTPRTVMAVAYNAYGGALMRQDQLAAAMAAFNQAIYYDPEFGLPVMNAAEVNFRLGNVREATALYDRAGRMPIGEAAKREALRRRVSGALNGGDCPAGAAAFRDARALSKYDEQWERWMEARLLVSCEYEEAKAYAIVRTIATLHPDSANSWIYLSLVLSSRPGNKYDQEMADAAQRAVDNTADPHGILNYFAHINLASFLARIGQIDRAMALIDDARNIVKTDRPDLELTLADVRSFAGDFEGVERIIEPLIATEEGRRPEAFTMLGTALGKQGKVAAALATFRQGQKLFPMSCTLYDKAGNLLLQQRRMPEAIAEFERGIAAVKKCGLPYISEARAMIALNRIAEARAKLNALVEAAPRSDGASEAGELLRGLAKAR